MICLFAGGPLHGQTIEYTTGPEGVVDSEDGPVTVMYCAGKTPGELADLITVATVCPVGAEVAPGHGEIAYRRHVVGRNFGPGVGRRQHVWVMSTVHGSQVEQTIVDAVIAAWYLQGVEVTM